MKHQQFPASVVLAYRISIIYLLYAICRVVFFCLNQSMFDEKTIGEMFRVFQGGLVFDTSAIFYSNSLFILLSLLPFSFITKAWYQKILQWIFFITNSICIAANCIDVIYYRFTLKRTTSLVFEQFANETNLVGIFLKSIVDYWYITILFVALLAAMIYAYRFVKVDTQRRIRNPFLHYSLSTIILFVVLVLSWGGMRGGFRNSTRPITLSNAGKYVESSNEMVIVLNTPFAILRTIGKHSIDPKEYFQSETEVVKYFTAEHHLNSQGTMKKENIVLIMIESFASEYTGFFTKDIENYNGYTPFFDSLCKESLTFESSFANGRKSIDALPSVYLSIPHFKVPYVLSQYSGNHIRSLAHILNDEGYETSFFHGAPNGSMGFDAFTNVVGVSEYYGKNEYGNNDHFDGMWGIWDEHFFQYFAREMNNFKEPFFSTLFTLSSHHPYLMPEEYVGKFPKGNLPIHECIGYTDFALKCFFETAKKQSWYNNTLFVIMADHASYEDLPEYRNIIGSYSIPIVFYKPDGTMKGVDSTHVAQQIDMYPTLLSYLNYKGDFVAHGKNLFDEKAPEYAFTYDHFTYQVISTQYVLQFNETGVVGLYEYKEDSLLEENLQDSLQEVVTELYNYGKAFLQESSRRVIEDDLILKE